MADQKIARISALLQETHSRLESHTVLEAASRYQADPPALETPTVHHSTQPCRPQRCIGQEQP